jgi:hypothetical protein
MRLGVRIGRAIFEKAHRDISKLAPKVIIDKNGHRKTVYVKLGIAVKKENRVEAKGYKPVQHDGEFVLTRNGSKDFGEISPEIAREIKRQAGKIRLRMGEQESNSEQGYGERHIERPKRIKELKLLGFANARDFVAYIAENYDAIYEGDKGSLILYKKGEHHTEIISRLEPAKDGDFWDVKTAYITRKDSKKNKKPLWERQSGF